ncbi:zinc finger BED domain-containing protein 4-like [Drosophila obscura]|uniref:zinc finger BED domain-containing protein 4-like n=1 Tax=Drosophila obscura TaxID=7282 RepID=UPI001BB1D79F|nr:zinc finger BED domain-containing protein 4-like [Drosophila obscura]
MDRFLQRGKRRSSLTPSVSSAEMQAWDSSSTDSEKDLATERQTHKKKNKISQVWKYFKRSEDKKFANCINCGKEYKTSGNTSNLHDHLKRFHPGLVHVSDSSTPAAATSKDTDNIASTSSSCRSSMHSVASYFKRAVLYDTNSKRKNDIDRALTEMIAKDVQPYNIVENEGFVNYSQVLDPRYKLPSKTHLRDVLMLNMFKETSAKLLTILEDISYISVTCDLWTSRANDSFLTVTCHFVYNYNLKTASLATRKLLDTTNHSAQNIANTLQDVLNNWNVLEKTVCIVTDNASSMLKACEILKIQNLPCFAHTLNLVVHDGLKFDNDDLVKALFTKCKTIVRFFKHSTISGEKFKMAQDEFSYTLLQEVPTRWNSFYLMIQRILATNDAISTVLLSTTKAPLPFTAEEINILKDLEKILAFFQQASEKISGGKYVTISLIIPMAYGLYRKLENLLPQLQTLQGKKMQNTLLESIKKRLSIYEQRSLTRMATILDPRFKKNGFQHYSNAEQASTAFENELLNLTVKENPVNLSPATETKTQDTFFDFLDERPTSKQTNARTDAIIIKRQYLERDIAAQEMDPLLWIMVNQTDFPLLKRLFLKYLCIPATSVESERVFSKAGQIVSERRTGLKEENCAVGSCAPGGPTDAQWD